jgi:tryptophanyl-tRNA synthetase
MNQIKKKTILSGVQPSSTPHLGNYLGAIKNWIELQRDFECFFCTVDLHAITVAQEPEKLTEYTYMMTAFYLACGLDPKQSSLFLQSHIPEHAELAWVLNCMSYMGELSRMNQFKDKSQKQGGENISMGLFAYPVLQAADILLYQADLVPVGEDQKQHIELTRNLALRFNNRFKKNTFTLPEPLIKKEGGRIMDLQEPTAKMSKSAKSLAGVVFFDDSDKEISKKFKTAMTDSATYIDPENASEGIRNLLEIMALISNKPMEALWEEYRGKMYGYLKKDLAEAAVGLIAPIRNKALEIVQDKEYIRKILQEGEIKARVRAQQTLKNVYECVGFISKF